MNFIRRSLLSRSLAVLLIWIASPVVAQDEPPWQVVVQTEDSRKVFVNSPSFAVLPNGHLLVSHLYYGDEIDREQAQVTHIQRSEDGGKTWAAVTKLEGIRWGNLFVVGDSVYLIGVERRYGRLLICKSTDNGTTWTKPDDSSGYLTNQKGYYTFRNSPEVIDGRVWTCVERLIKGRFHMMVVSAPADADLLNANSWTKSNSLSLAKTSLGGKSDKVTEGNVLPGKDSVRILSRLAKMGGETASLATASATDEGTMRFGLDRFVRFPGGGQSFCVRFDAKENCYWAVSNPQSKPFSRNNRLAMLRSDDLLNWEIRYIPVSHEEGVWRGLTAPICRIDGDDLLIITNCAWGNTPGSGRADRIVFLRVAGFRNLSIADSPPIVSVDRTKKVDHADFELTGSGYDLKNLEVGADLFFAYRQFKWQDVPAEFQGWKFAMMLPTRDSNLKIDVKQNAQLYVAVAEDQQPVDLTGWKPSSNALVYADKRSKTVMRIFTRRVKAGEALQIPQESWSGTVLLVPPDQ
ncbi:MAG: sialidase family protein [Planctomycetota bacterium]